MIQFDIKIVLYTYNKYRQAKKDYIEETIWCDDVVDWVQNDLSERLNMTMIFSHQVANRLTFEDESNRRNAVVSILSAWSDDD